MKIQPTKVINTLDTKAHRAWVNHFNQCIVDICKDVDIAAELAKSEENACKRTGINWSFYAAIDRKLGFRAPKK